MSSRLPWPPLETRLIRAAANHVYATKPDSRTGPGPGLAAAAVPREGVPMSKTPQGGRHYSADYAHHRTTCRLDPDMVM